MTLTKEPTDTAQGKEGESVSPFLFNLSSNLRHHPNNNIIRSPFLVPADFNDAKDAEEILSQSQENEYIYPDYGYTRSQSSVDSVHAAQHRSQTELRPWTKLQQLLKLSGEIRYGGSSLHGRENYPFDCLKF